AIGAGVGAIAGAVGAQGAQRKLTKRANNAALNYNAQFQEQYANGGPIIPTSNILTNNLYGNFNTFPNQTPFYGFRLPGMNKMVNNFNSNTVQELVNDEIPYYAEQNPISNAQQYLINQGYALNGGADGKW